MELVYMYVFSQFTHKLRKDDKIIMPNLFTIKISSLDISDNISKRMQDYQTLFTVNYIHTYGKLAVISQGLNLNSVRGPPPVMHASLFLHASFFLMQDCASWILFFVSSTVRTQEATAFTLKQFQDELNFIKHFKVSDTHLVALNINKISFFRRHLPTTEAY